MAEWIAALVETIPLSRQWTIDGTIHPEYGLCFSLRPLEQSRFIAGHAADWRDLQLLAQVLTEHVQFPQQDQHTYRDKQKAAQELVPALV